MLITDLNAAKNRIAELFEENLVGEYSISDSEIEIVFDNIAITTPIIDKKAMMSYINRLFEINAIICISEECPEVYRYPNYPDKSVREYAPGYITYLKILKHAHVAVL